LDATKIDSITLGGVRLPKTFHKRMAKLMPDEPLFAAGMQDFDSDMVAYEPKVEAGILGFCQQQIALYTDQLVFDYPVSTKSMAKCN